MTTDTQTITASVENYRGTPRKVRLIADLVRGKQVAKALAELKFVNKRHADGVAAVIKSAVANARHNAGIENAKEWVISSIQVSEGKSLKRIRPGSRGRALPIQRRLSHIRLAISPKNN